MIIVAPQLNDWKETSARQMDPETSGGRHCGLWHLCLFQTSDRRISFPADSHFVFLDDSEPLIFFFIDYLAIMGLFVFIGHYLAGWLKRLDKKGSSK